MFRDATVALPSPSLSPAALWAAQNPSSLHSIEWSDEGFFFSFARKSRDFHVLYISPISKSEPATHLWLETYMISEGAQKKRLADGRLFFPTEGSGLVQRALPCRADEAMQPSADFLKGGRAKSFSSAPRLPQNVLCQTEPRSVKRPGAPGDIWLLGEFRGSS